MSPRVGRTPATPPPRARSPARGDRRRCLGPRNRSARPARPTPAPQPAGPRPGRCVTAIRGARPAPASHPRAPRARARQPPPRPGARPARWKPRLRSAHIHDAPSPCCSCMRCQSPGAVTRRAEHIPDESATPRRL